MSQPNNGSVPVAPRLTAVIVVAWVCVALGTGHALTPTPTPCDASGARLELSLSATPSMPSVGEVVDLEVGIANPSDGLAGLRSYSLHGAAPVFTVELVDGSDPAVVRYRLTAVEAGRAELVVSVHYETSHRCFGYPTFFFRSSSSDRFAIEVAGGPTPSPTSTVAIETPTPTPTSNRPPPVGVVGVTPNPAQPGERVDFDSAGSFGAINGRYWRQVAGAPVALQGCTPSDFGCYGDTAWFVAPAVAESQVLRFELLLTSYGSTSWDYARFNVTILPLACAGDCDRDGCVTVAELIAAVAIALDGGAPHACAAADADASGGVTIDDLIVALANALDGCRSTTDG